MAGMLPGVECARRRRFHQSCDTSWAAVSSSTRRSSFCLYTSNHESSQTSISSSLGSITKEAYEAEKLGEVARQAKERLDERLRNQRKSSSKMQEASKSSRGAELAVGELQTEDSGTKKNGSAKKFNWAKMRRKAAE